MRIVIAAISFCEYVIQQANSLAKLGHGVLIIMPSTLIDSTVGVDMDNLISQGVEYYIYAIKKRSKWSFYGDLFRKISAFSPDVLHVHDNGELETLALVLRFRRMPLVVTVHDVTYHPGNDASRSRRRFFIEKKIRKYSAIIHLHGNVLKKNLKSVCPDLAKKAHVIPHGSLSVFKNWEESTVMREPYTCLFFGRMEKYRGIDNLVKIGAILKYVVPDVKIIVAGRGSELEKHKNEMMELGIFEIHDSFIPDKDVNRLFRRASLLLLPYHEASQSGVVMMGLPFGVPMVATDVGSIPEIVVDGEHGRIVGKGDIDGFADKILELLSDSRQLARMSASCLELADKLSFDRLAGNFERMYESALSKSKVCSGATH